MSRPSPPCRRYPGTVCALLVVLVQLTALTWVPAAHAARTRGSDHAAVENTHSSDCSEVHVEARCSVCAATQRLWPTQRRLEMAGASLVIRCGTTARELPAAVSIPTHPARAPPSR